MEDLIAVEGEELSDEDKAFVIDADAHVPQELPSDKMEMVD